MERKRGTTHSERMDRKPNTENENSRTRRRTSSRNRLSAGEDKSRRNTGKSATQGRKNVTYSPIRLLNLFLCPRSKQDSDDVLSKCVIIQGKTIFLLLSKATLHEQNKIKDLVIMNNIQIPDYNGIQIFSLSFV
ncbi:hypothetical protein MG293_011242 [Ovis ammon polii]|uniref:Uncharacterized protein n=1 Tax=Ovis ammon polii TaxID=230172 RepID=A0AAD4Y5Z9_OVIAM|nr:hypothetical protein MG293_011242 [Ovis ammon polii]